MSAVTTPAMILHAYGGPENLLPGEVELPPPASDEVQIRHTGIGVNYIDTYFRRGVYPIELPAVIGDQAVGVVEAVGTSAGDFAVGDRVGYGSSSRAYLERRVIKTKDIVKLPKAVSDEAVAATLTRGMTAEYLLFRLHELAAGETVIVHAATGGTGLIVCEWAKSLGATVIATVGAENKFARAEAAGADYVLLHSADDFVDQVRGYTNGRGVDVVYDSIGLDTFNKSIECLRPRGLMVAYGNASGKPDPFNVLDLARLGSLYLTRPRLNEYVATKAELELSAARFFDALSAGVVSTPEVQTFALEKAPDAHRHLEDRSKASIPVLIP